MCHVVATDTGHLQERDVGVLCWSADIGAARLQGQVRRPTYGSHQVIHDYGPEYTYALGMYPLELMHKVPVCGTNVVRTAPISPAAFPYHALRRATHRGGNSDDLMW